MPRAGADAVPALLRMVRGPSHARAGEMSACVVEGFTYSSYRPFKQVSKYIIPVVLTSSHYSGSTQVGFSHGIRTQLSVRRNQNILELPGSALHRKHRSRCPAEQVPEPMRLVVESDEESICLPLSQVRAH